MPCSQGRTTKKSHVQTQLMSLPGKVQSDASVHEKQNSLPTATPYEMCGTDKPPLM